MIRNQVLDHLCELLGRVRDSRYLRQQLEKPTTAVAADYWRSLHGTEPPWTPEGCEECGGTRVSWGEDWGRRFPTREIARAHGMPARCWWCWICSDRGYGPTPGSWSLVDEDSSSVVLQSDTAAGGPVVSVKLDLRWDGVRDMLIALSHPPDRLLQSPRERVVLLYDRDWWTP